MPFSMRGHFFVAIVTEREMGEREEDEMGIGQQWKKGQIPKTVSSDL